MKSVRTGHHFKTFDERCLEAGKTLELQIFDVGLAGGHDEWGPACSNSSPRLTSHHAYLQLRTILIREYP
ncbi:hypothetical protein ebA2119 [Aromatoleum aromaticum EbN1]|uniref:Uncharacterized protein n=1 Tax=Aromatoleum aromaticum (strain DSM 19018 / LMG 30748 / EbN1) TaxID=76114 RepID=Q5P5W6_AROAE|nr:hypothetical protein ebA2119 [Aromatoleum aromaticum EbN1]